MSAQHAYRDEPLLTLREFERLPEEDEYRVELTRGRLVREPRPAPLHGRVLTRVAHRLELYAEASGRGAVLSDVGFVLSLDPATVRGPDVAFVCRERIPEQGYGHGFWHLAPDLAVEIVSPSNRAPHLQQKVLEYLDAGARLVWVADPRTQCVTVYRPGREPLVLGGDAELDGGDVLPGLRLRVLELFML